MSEEEYKAILERLAALEKQAAEAAKQQKSLKGMIFLSMKKKKT